VVGALVVGAVVFGAAVVGALVVGADVVGTWVAGVASEQAIKASSTAKKVIVRMILFFTFYLLHNEVYPDC
jgi:hypothetical protein